MRVYRTSILQTKSALQQEAYIHQATDLVRHRTEARDLDHIRQQRQVSVAQEENGRASDPTLPKQFDFPREVYKVFKDYQR